MNKSELIKRYAEQHTGLTRAQAESDVNCILNLIGDAIVNEEDGLAIVGLFTVKKTWRKETLSNNPQNPGEKITIPAHYGIKFSASSTLKKRLNPDAESE